MNVFLFSFYKLYPWQPLNKIYMTASVLIFLFEWLFVFSVVILAATLHGTKAYVC